MIVQMLLGGGWTTFHDDEASEYVSWLTSGTLVQSANAIGSLTLDVAPDCPYIGDVAVGLRARVKNGDDWEFYGRTLQVKPYMESDGRLGKEVVCEDALGFLKDTAVQFDSTKKWFDGLNSDYSVEVDADDGTRTLPAKQLVEILVNQHNSTIGDNDGDKWKKVKLGTGSCSHDVTVSAEYEKSTFDCLADIADDTGCDLRYRYDGSSVYIDFGHSLGDSGGTFAVGDNVAKAAMEASAADVVTRMFPFGETYAKLKKESKKATQVSGALKGEEWSSKKGTMCRFDVEGALKVALTVGARDKDYAMVFFTDGGVSAKKTEILKKYTTKKTTGDNLERRYEVPEDAKYCYVYGSKASGTKLTAYSFYKNGAGEEIKRDYRVDLGFWLDYARPSVRDKLLAHYGLTIGSTKDDSGDYLWYLQKNADVYGVIEGVCVKDNLLKTDKIEDGGKAVYALRDLVEGSKKKQKSARLKAERFLRYACKKASKAAKGEVTIEVDGYDLAQAGIGADKVRLFGTWRVKNEKIGLDREARALRIERNVLSPWDVTLELGKKASTATGSGWGHGELDYGSTAGSAPTAEKDDDDSAVDEYATLANQYSDMATAAATEAVEKADELDALSYRISVDSLAAGQMADDAYDSVHPIVDAMNSALQDAEQQAHELTAVKESQSKTVETTNDLARAVATYGYETEESVVRWRKTYTASLDAWASEDEETQAKIKAAYAKLYGEGGTADSPTADSAQGHLIAAKAANVEATAKEAEMRAELASAKAYQESCVKAYQSAQGSYDAAKANYDALKVKSGVERKRIDAALTALNGAAAKRDASQAAVDKADDRCAEAESSYAAAKAELATAEQKVAAAQAEVETAVNGIHELYSSTIEQTAKGITLTASKVDEQGERVGALEVTADEIKGEVKDAQGNVSKLSQKVDEISGTVSDAQGNVSKLSQKVDSLSSEVANAATKSYVDQRADGVVTTITAKGYQTASDVDTAITSKGYQTSQQVQTTVSHTLESWKVSYTDIDGLSSYMSFTNTSGTGTLTLGGSASSVVLGGSSSTISMCNNRCRISSDDTLSTGSSSFTLSNGITQIAIGNGGIAFLYNRTAFATFGASGGAFSCGSLSCGSITSSKEIQSTGAGTSSSSANCRLTTASPKGTIRFASSSSKRYKHDIEDISADYLSPELLYDLPVRQFIFNDGYLVEDDDRNGFFVPGFIAEEVAEHYPMAADLGEEEGTFENWNEKMLIPPMLKLIQEQKLQLDALAERVAKLECDGS